MPVDEVTSPLDAQIGLLNQQALSGLMKNRIARSPASEENAARVAEILRALVAFYADVELAAGNHFPSVSLETGRLIQSNRLPWRCSAE